MALSLKEVTLDTNIDQEAVLVFRDGRLVAVAACLGEIHTELRGHWFIEAAFAQLPGNRPETFKTLAGLEAWLLGLDRSGG